jgi:integrase
MDCSWPAFSSGLDFAAYGATSPPPTYYRFIRLAFLLNNGLRLEVVSKLLGHTTTTITEQAYAQLLDDTTRRELLHHLNHT